MGDIDAVEVIGGSSRVPAIKDIFTSVFKRDLSTTLNVDEVVSRGCALQCAMLSPTFKVRDFSVTDIQPFPIQLKWQAPMEGEDGSVVKNWCWRFFSSSAVVFMQRDAGV